MRMVTVITSEETGDRMIISEHTPTHVEIRTESKIASPAWLILSDQVRKELIEVLQSFDKPKEEKS